MRKLLLIVCCYVVTASGGYALTLADFVSSRHDYRSGRSSLPKVIALIHRQAANLNAEVLQLALTAYNHASKVKHLKHVITIIDYSKPSTERRLWVIDLQRQKVLYNTWVTHGKNSGYLRAKSFSNQLGSLKSSFGVFVTEEPYFGKVGYALRLRGLEHGVNDNAYKRAVVVHGAWYANPAILNTHHQLGRSFGCPVVSEQLAAPIINTIKNHAMVFAYYPDRKWLHSSAFLV